jgi:hypothetical protein
MMQKIIFLPVVGLLAICLLSQRVSANGWPKVFDPLEVVTLNFELDPQIWEDIKRDQNFYDPILNIRVPVLMWADGEEPITVQMRRKSDAALPSESDPQKVSLKIDINEFVSGQRWRDLTKLSLENGNGGNGPVREGLSMNLHRLASEHGFYRWDAGYASWVRVVVNGEYIGLYASPEQRNKQFLRNRGLYKPGSVWIYEVNGGTALDTTIATTHSPTYDHLCYLPFRNACIQPDLEAVLPKWIDMDGMLTMAAIEAFTGNSDGLFSKNGKNSFAVDFLPSSQFPRWYLPWDLDNGMTSTTFNIFTGGPGPQSNRPYQTHILGHPWFGLQYRHIMNDLLDGPLSPGVLNAFISELETVLAPHLAEDANNMMGGANATAVANHFQSIRDWVVARSTNVRGQVGTLVAPPVFHQEGGAIASGFAMNLSHPNDIGTIYFTTDGRDPRAPGGAPAGTAFAWPVPLEGTRHVKARVLKGTEWSALREATFTVPGHADALKITEIMYRPLKDDEGIGVELEFLELKNTGGSAIDLSGLRFTNGISYNFPNGEVLEPGEFLVLGENEEHFQQHYGRRPFQVYLRKLSNSGERLTIRDALHERVFSVRYEVAAPWPILANGHGFSLVPVDPNTNPEPDAAENWRASASVGGSPGSDDPEPLVPVVFINEALAHNDLPLRDSIEIYNPNDTAVDITGWFLTDKLTEPKRWKIPPTVIEPFEYAVFFESDELGDIFPEHFGSAFGLSASGEEVYIVSADAAENLTGFSHGFSFGASENGVSFGRHTTSIGEEYFVAQRSLTLGAPNSGPLVGPVVITELMYNPAGTHDEFIELKNITADVVKLYDPEHPANTWRIGGIAWVFPQGIELAAGEIFLVVPVEPAAFRERYSIPAETRIFGPYTGNLSNSGERIRLRKPGSPNFENDVWVIPLIDVDSLTYADRAPWPSQPDGYGPSLERISVAAYANDPMNWRPSLTDGGTPGIVHEEPPLLSYQNWITNYPLTGEDAAPHADPDGDGIVNLLEYAFGMDPTVADWIGLPTPGMVSDQGADYLSITYNRLLGATNIHYTPEFGDDFLNWSPEVAVEVNQASPSANALTEVITVRDTVPMEGSSRRFGRVRVDLE